MTDTRLDTVLSIQIIAKFGKEKLIVILSIIQIIRFESFKEEGYITAPMYSNLVFFSLEFNCKNNILCLFIAESLW